MVAADEHDSEDRRETEPLLGDRSEPTHGVHDASLGEEFDNVPKSKRQLGLVSAIFLIFNRIVGTGIFATPSVILRAAGSPGMSFVMWISGCIVATAGTAVYVELGTGLPRSGGEKNYLEFIFRRPLFLMTCIFAMYATLTGWASANSVVFGEYFTRAVGLPTTQWSTRIVGFITITACLLLHGCRLQWGLRVQNTLGMFSLTLLVLISISGLLSLVNCPGFRLDPLDRPHNFSSEVFWAGTSSDMNGFVTGLVSVIWSFHGYQNANYAMSEIKDPVRTIKRAAPIALVLVTIVYLLVNVAYFAVVPAEDISGGGTLVAALFFNRLFGSFTDRILSACIAICLFGNMLTILFVHGRVVQELGREGILPLSAMFASNAPFNAPLAGLTEQWLISALFMLLTPPGDAYVFMLNTAIYPITVINVAVTAGLFVMRLPHWYKVFEWAPPFRTNMLVIAFFLVSNLFLALVPLVPPATRFAPYEHLPYWVSQLHVAVVFAMSLIGILYWYIWTRWLPAKGHYRLLREWVLQDDGVSRSVFIKEPL